MPPPLLARAFSSSLLPSKMKGLVVISPGRSQELLSLRIEAHPSRLIGTRAMVPPAPSTSPTCWLAVK